ncbi:MAG: hypothetical protein H6571_18860 [Lewinellaceae bacterium]|nr:hypothetical protein [Lewinellaceae bacterium]
MQEEIVSILSGLQKENNMIIRWNGVNQFFLENSFCKIEFILNEYDETVIMVLEDLKKKVRYPFYKLMIIKKVMDVEYDKSKETILITKLRERVLFIQEYLKEELKGDFSNLQNINSDDSNSIL